MSDSMPKLGKYEIIKEIGHGGFAVVYKARDPGLDRMVALKVLHPAYAERPDVVRRFLTEAQATAKLRHPHIVRIYEAGEAREQPYIAMEYLPGHTLAKSLEDEGAMSLERALPILEQVADALDYAHDQGVIHRDVKPNNIMVEEIRQGVQVTLMDFGLMKAMESSESLTSVGTILGSPEYMAPEQADPGRRDEISSATDRYALGVVAYHMLTGRVPFPGNNLATLNAHLNLTPPDPKSIREDLPASVARVLLKALSKVLNERYSTARAMVQALRQAQVPEKWRRRIDAAAPSHAKVGQSIDLFVQVRFPDSPLLGIEDWPTKQKPSSIEQVSETVVLEFPVDRRTGRPGPARLEIRVVAPNFQIGGAARQLVEVPPDRDSKRISFLLTAKDAGSCKINVEVYSVDGVYLSTIPVEAEAFDKESPSPTAQIASMIIVVAVGQESPPVLEWLLGQAREILRDSVWQGIGAIVAIVALAVAIGIWRWPDIREIFVPSPTVVVLVTPSPTSTSTATATLVVVTTPSTSTFTSTLTLSPTLTLTGTPAPTHTPAPTATATATGTPTMTATPTHTPTPTPTSTDTLTPTPCLPSASFVKDVAIPDGTNLQPGTKFTKTWQMLSDGCARWPVGTEWVFVSGDQMNAPTSVSVSDTPLGSTADISVEMVAPESPGTYKGIWQMQGPNGMRFGVQTYVEIVVPTPLPTATLAAMDTPTQAPPPPTPTPTKVVPSPKK